MKYWEFNNKEISDIMLNNNHYLVLMLQEDKLKIIQMKIYIYKNSKKEL